MVAVLTASPTRPKVRPHVGTASSRRYERRRPEKTPLYKIVSEHLEGWLENRAVAEHPVLAHVERELRSYLTCGILCFGFGRARCTSCGQGFVVAFSCKGRGVCPSCNGRRMAQTAAHLVDHVIPPVPGAAVGDLRASSLTAKTRSRPSRGSSSKRSNDCFVLRRARPVTALGRARLARDSAPSPFCTASDRRSITTCISMRARPTASSCRPVTGRRRSCRLD
jgi:hypothetical protein